MTAEQYKKSERDFRFYREVMEKYSSLAMAFTIRLQGFNNVVDEETRQVKGTVSRIFREHEVPYVEFSYLEYDEEDRALRSKTISPAAKDSVGTIEHIFASTVMNFNDISMQAELGLIPTGVYCPDPVAIRLDVFKSISMTLSR